MGRTGEGASKRQGDSCRRSFGAPVKGRKGLGRHPEGRGVLGGKYEVEVGSQNEMLTGKRREV